MPSYLGMMYWTPRTRTSLQRRAHRSRPRRLRGKSTGVASPRPTRSAWGICRAPSAGRQAPTALPLGTRSTRPPPRAALGSWDAEGAEAGPPARRMPRRPPGPRSTRTRDRASSSCPRPRASTHASTSSTRARCGGGVAAAWAQLPSTTTTVVNTCLERSRSSSYTNCPSGRWATRRSASTGAWRTWTASSSWPCETRTTCTSGSPR
mmetsp:Transcript_25952/g.70187  ORF Transcript_25952/g.70187 Transcript_25952/m.70187 type:complete len:207 (+) Transcript_25952:2085-2705(+)